MSIESLLSANAESFGGIIKGDHRYIVPVYQRDYSWEQENWDDLWNDIITNRDSQSRHYMGSIVIIPQDKKEYNVIDGQQRLTTLSIIILSAISIIKDQVDKGIYREENVERIKILTSDYIGKKSLTSLNTENKIKLNELNNGFYSTYLINFREPINIKRESNSNKLLYKCFQYFKEKLTNDICNESNLDELISLIEFISDNLLFIKITATDDLSAFLIFETLNDRGLSLSVTDLLKNYFFSAVSPDDRAHIKVIWGNIIEKVSYPGFPRFLRYYWIMKRGLISEKALFKNIKRNVNSAERVFDFIDEMSRSSDVYTAIGMPNHEMWAEDKNARKYIRELSLFNVTQCYPLLMAAHSKLAWNEFVKVIKICSIISFRYLIISKNNPNALEKAYSDAALNLTKSNEITTASQVFKLVESVYVDDESFCEKFETAEIRTKRSAKLAKYIVYAIENHLSGNNYNFEDDLGTLEHILPENTNEYWDRYFEPENHEKYVYRIGNFTILEMSKNKNAGNGTIDEKKKEYNSSKYKLSSVFGYNRWDLKNLQDRQKYMAKQAKAIWSINY